MRNIPEERLDRKVVASWRIGNAAGTVVLGLCLLPLAYAIVGNSPGAPAFLPAIAWGIVALYLVVTVIIAPAIRYTRFRFSVDAEEVDIMRGIIVYKRTIIPLIRVQHVDTRQGPVMRLFGLASVTIATAAGQHEIPGLQLEQADALRDRVAQLARLAKEDM